MSKFLAELLQAKEPLFSAALRQLEEVSGKPSIDVKLQAEIIETFDKKVKELGLDPKDSTGEEIYKAVINKVKADDRHLAKTIGHDDPDQVRGVKTAVVNAFKDFEMPRGCWVLKDEVAAEMLRQKPPVNIMKRLHYENVDKMLESENLYEVYGALRFAEDEDWLNDFNEQYKTLTKEDFHDRDVEIVLMPRDRWGDIAEHFVEKKRHLNTHLKELGVVLILPSTLERMPGITTKVVSMTFHYYNEIRLYSAFFKSQQNKPNFGEIVVETLIADPDNGAVMAGQDIHWRVIQRYFGKLKDEYHPEIFEPHVQPEDLHWRKAEAMMYELDPELRFWQGLDFVGRMYDERPLSLNLIDMALSYSNNVAYDERYIYHFRESLWNEVFMRYMGQKVLEKQILMQLDNDMIEPEDLED